MNIRLLAQKIARSLREDGVHGSVRKVPQYLGHAGARGDDFDSRHGTDTGGFEHIWRFRIASKNARFGTHYRATDERHLTQALTLLGEDLSAFTFIDLGCGKGRTLMVASRFGFRRVIGVEFAHELAAIARANLALTGLADATVIEGDAADFVFPDQPLILYLYNPFSSEVMTRVIANLGRARAPSIYVIYKNPAYADTVLDASRFLRRAGPLIRESNIQIWRGARC